MRQQNVKFHKDTYHLQCNSSLRKDATLDDGSSLGSDTGLSKNDTLVVRSYVKSHSARYNPENVFRTSTAFKRDYHVCAKIEGASNLEDPSYTVQRAALGMGYLRSERK